MEYNLIKINQNSKLSLQKSKNLLKLTDKILEKKNDKWIDKLILWANENDVPDEYINFDLNKVARDIYDLIIIKIIEDLDTEKKEIVINDGMANQRIFDEISHTIMNIINEKAILINLPFLFVFNEKPYHLYLDIDNIKIEQILNKNSIVKKQHYGIHRDKKLLVNTKTLNLSWQSKLLIQEIFQLANLREINLIQNSFSRTEITGNDHSVIKNMSNLNNLEKIYIDGSGFKSLPNLFQNPAKLKFLWLENNKYLESISHDFIYLENINELYLKNNPNLQFTKEQKKWIELLKKNGCNVEL